MCDLFREAWGFEEGSSKPETLYCALLEEITLPFDNPRFYMLQGLVVLVGDIPIAPSNRERVEQMHDALWFGTRTAIATGIFPEWSALNPGMTETIISVFPVRFLSRRKAAHALRKRMYHHWHNTFRTGGRKPFIANNAAAALKCLDRLQKKYGIAHNPLPDDRETAFNLWVHPPRMLNPRNNTETFVDGINRLLADKQNI